MRSRVLAAVLVVLALGAPAVRAATPAATPYPGGRWEPGPARYGTAVQQGVRVRMDDGAVLVVDVVRPTDPTTGKVAAGRFPVLLNQDFYAGGAQGLAGQASVPGQWFVERGYVFVHAHDRGLGGSEGQPDSGFGPRIGRDGVDLAYWAAALPGVDGRVGLQGCSALGVVQLSTLMALGALQREGVTIEVPGPTADAPGHPVAVTPATNPIAAALPACIGASLYQEQWTDNGVPSTIWALAAASPVVYPVLLGPSPSSPSSSVEPTTWFADMVAGGDMGYDRAYWQERDAVLHAGDIARTGVPVLTWVGWDEGGFMGAQWLLAALQQAAPHHAGRYQALIGDWGHGGGLDEGIELEWFDTWLRSVNTGLQAPRSALHLQEVSAAGGGRWLGAPGYPMTTAHRTIDVPVAGKRIAWGVGPQLALALTKPVAEDMTLLGPTALRLSLRSSNTNAQLFAELQDVGPDGTTTPITHGSILGSRRRTDPSRTRFGADGLPIEPKLVLDRDEPLAPGQPVQLDVPLQPVTWRLAAGHSLRLVLAPNAGERCAPTGIFGSSVGCLLSVPLGQSLAGGTYDLLDDAAHRSWLHAALVPSADLPTVRSGGTPTSDGTALPLDW